jgi:hypothetical protein
MDSRELVATNTRSGPRGRVTHRRWSEGDLADFDKVMEHPRWEELMKIYEREYLPLELRMWEIFEAGTRAHFVEGDVGKAGELAEGYADIELQAEPVWAKIIPVRNEIGEASGVGILNTWRALWFASENNIVEAGL